MNEHLGRAVAALDDKAYEVALTELLEAWGACRHERIANAIDAVSARITRPRPGGKTIDEKEKAWHAIAERHDPADVSALLAVFSDIKKADPLRFRLVELDRMKRDPRIAAAMTKMMEALPVPGGTGVRPVQLAFELLGATRDRRQIAELERIREITTPSGAARYYIREHIPKLVEHLSGRAEPTLDAAALALLDEIDACLAETKSAPRTGGDALFAAVYNRPEDDAPRAVLADFLQESGDPRGEFIALQLANANRKRQAELLRDYGRDWLGPLEPVILKKNLAFERGFLARCAIKSDTTEADPIANRPEWATVIDVDVHQVRSGRHAFLDRMPCLRAIRGVWGVPTDRPLLEALDLVRAGSDTVAALAQFSKLRELHLEFDGTVAELAPLSALQLDSLALDLTAVYPGAIAPLLALPIADIAIKLHYRAWRFRLSAETLSIKWIVGYEKPSAAYFDQLLAILGELPSRITRVEFADELELPPNVSAALARFL